jgi:hypothetical protein
MIDISKKLFTFYKMFDNVRTVFSHLLLKFVLSAIMSYDPLKKFLGKLSIWISQKRRILCP